MPKTTKRKRSTKHRGNAAGMIETRGRTGRKLTSQERRTSASTSTKTKATKADRLDKPPSWRGSAQRAVIAAGLVLVFSTFLLKMPLKNMVALLPVVLLIYVPLGYYTDLWVYRRRQRRAGTAGK